MGHHGEMGLIIGSCGHAWQVTPKNEIERLFNVVVIMSAMVIFSTFISAITNAMNQLRNLNSPSGVTPP